MPYRVLIAPSGFKESLDAAQVAFAIAAGVRRALPGVALDLLPIVDGGEGTAKILAASAPDGRLVEATVTGPVGRPVRSQLALFGDEARPHTAVVEMAAAAGLRLVPRDQRDPGATTTFGVGELIGLALDAGVDRIVVGCGDSGTCDGGAGALQALGARVLDIDGAPVGRGGNGLVDVDRLDLSGLDPRLADVELLVACNPHNLLAGERGVARVFGPQKGSTAEQVEQLDAALTRWARVLGRDGVQPPGYDFSTAPGTGASGGLGAGLAGGLGARLVPRFELTLAASDLDRRVAAADLVITAEGAVDFQTPHGKAPSEVARRAKQRGKPVFALAGSIGAGARDVHDVGIDAFASVLQVPMPLAAAVAKGAQLLTDAAEQAMRMVLVGCAIGAQHSVRRSAIAS